MLAVAHDGHVGLREFVSTVVPEAVVALMAGTDLGPYRVVGLLGAGWMGEVYRARHTRLGRGVEVKVLAARLADDPERLRRIEQQARAAAAVEEKRLPEVFATLEST